MARVGLTALDEAKACPGYLVYAPMGGDGQVFLIDLNGNEVHSWKLPHPAGLYGYLLPNGNLFYGGKIQDESWDRFSSFKRFKGGVILDPPRGACGGLHVFAASALRVFRNGCRPLFA